MWVVVCDEYKSDGLLLCKAQHLLPDVSVFWRDTLFVLVLLHGEAAHPIQDTSGTDQIHRASLLHELRQWLPSIGKTGFKLI